MEIIIHLQAKKIDSDYKAAIEEYIKRLSPFCKAKINLCRSIDKITLKNNSMLYFVIPSENSPSSPDFAKLIQNNNLHGVSCIEFIICHSTFSDNLMEVFKDHNCDYFSVSSFCMSDQLTSVVLTEQIYRAYTILNNITYHK